jgi:hypothetical protein
MAITYLLIDGNVFRQESLFRNVCTSFFTHSAVELTIDNLSVTLAKYVFTSDSMW